LSLLLIKLVETKTNQESFCRLLSSQMIWLMNVALQWTLVQIKYLIFIFKLFFLVV
jgi:hypothetical protein